MRTKALLCAAVLAAGAATSMAQNVYSLNVVGYVNLTITNGYNLIANQLDLDGTMTNNTVAGVFSTNWPNLTKVYAYDSAGGTYGVATYSSGSKTWLGAVAAVNKALAPGKGVFVQLPAGNPTQTLTLVGNVVQGSYTLPITPGYQIVSSIAPISGGVKTALGYTPRALDKFFTYNAVTGLYTAHTWSGSIWAGGEPVPAVGDAMFLQAVSPATTWTQSFTVQ